MTSEDIELSKLWIAGWVLRTHTPYDHLKIIEFRQPLTDAFVAGRESLRPEIKSWEAGYSNLMHENDQIKDGLRLELKAERERSRRLYLLLKQVASGPLNQSLILRIDKILIDHEASHDE